jgi:hypothetical protein
LGMVSEGQSGGDLTMKKLIHYNPDQAGKLHCDACGYDLPDIQPFTKELIGAPCPKCGADMLTEKDYHDTIRMFRMVDWINKWFGWLGSEEAPANGPNVSVRHHNGEINIKIKG